MDRNIVPNRLKITKTVALRKESVDRNLSFSKIALIRLGRSPQGERG